MSLVTSLPIISKPLENNPDHLVWEALLTIDTRNIDPDKTRKVPKSIFITPNLNESKTPCPTGHKFGPDGKCYKTLNIDPLDILKTQIASLFNRNRTTIEYDEYDYNDYSDSTESMSGSEGTIGQYNVPLSLGFSNEHRPITSRFPTRVIKDESRIVLGINYEDEKNKQPFLVSTVEVAQSDDLKPYDIHSEKSATVENNTDDAVTTTMTSISSASNTNVVSNTEFEETTIDANTYAIDGETVATAPSILETTEYHTRPTNSFIPSTVGGNLNKPANVSSNGTFDEPLTIKNENMLPLNEENIGTILNPRALNEIRLNESNNITASKTTQLDTVDTEDIPKSSNEAELLAFSTEDTSAPLLGISSVNDEIATASTKQNKEILSAASIPPKNLNVSSMHRFSTPITDPVRETSDASTETSGPFPTATESTGQNLEALPVTEIGEISSSSTSTSPTEYNSETSSALSVNNTLEVDTGNSSVPAQARGLSSSADAHEIEIVQKYDSFDDRDIDAISGQNLTARLAEESLFQGNGMASIAENDSGNDASSEDIVTQIDTNVDVNESTEEPTEVDTTEDQLQVDIKSEPFDVVTPTFDISGDKSRYEALFPEEITIDTNYESSSMYTTLINTLKQNQRSIKADDGALIVQMGNSNDDWYRIVAPEGNEKSNGTENVQNINLNSEVAKHYKTNTPGAQIETDQTKRLGKNCYLRNFSEHFYIMCT